MMIPAEADIRVARNGVYRDLLYFRQSGQTFDITGWAARMQVRRYPGEAGTPLIDRGTSVTSSNGSHIAITDAAGGILEIFIAKADIAALPEAATPPQPQSIFAYDVVLTEPGGDENVYLKGALVVDEGVTK